MEELEQNILDVIHKPQLAALATVTEQNNPWVRYVVTVGDGDFNIRCATFTSSRKVAQIKHNPNVHLTLGVTNFMDMHPYIQVQGKGEVTTDHDERHNFWNDLLAPIFKGPDDPNYCIVLIKPYRIEYITPGVFEPEVWVR